MTWRQSPSTLLLSIALAACGDDDTSSVRDAGAMADASQDGDALDGELPPLGPRGCLRDRDCTSGACFHPLVEIGAGVGYCTTTCAADADCDVLDGGGFEYACVPGATGSRCLRVCPYGHGCPDGHACAVGAPTGGGHRADVCVDLTEDLCEADSDCAPEAHCRFLLADQERVVAGCYTPLDSSGRPASGLRAGSACDPATNVHDQPGITCEGDADCPAGWRCRILPYTDGFSQCHPPASESCLFARGRINGDSFQFHCRDPRFCGCLDEGVCGGLCRSDADCGAAMRCSQATVVALHRGTPAVYDDSFHTARFCTYADGSRTSCTREADCATTGPSGARETCQLTTDIDGAVSGICVTQPPDVGDVGDPCGDDPATAEVDYRPCVNDCIDGVCASACETDADCPSGQDCQMHFLDQVVSAGMCTPAAACDRDADCSGSDVCQLVPTAEGAVTRCGPPRGELGAYGYCFGASEVWGFDVIEQEPAFLCASLDCDHMQICSALCRVDADCPAEMRCVEMTRTVNGRGTLDRSDDLTATYSACELSYGTLAACGTDVECADFEGCLPTVVGGVPVNQCIETYGTIPIGGACAFGCVSPSPCVVDYLRYDAYCTGACTVDADCGDSGLVCRRYPMDRLGVDSRLCVYADDPRGSAL